MANSSIIDLNAHLIRLGRGNLDGLDFQGLASGPGYSCLLLD